MREEEGGRRVEGEGRALQPLGRSVGLLCSCALPVRRAKAGMLFRPVCLIVILGNFPNIAFGFSLLS